MRCNPLLLHLTHPPPPSSIHSIDAIFMAYHIKFILVHLLGLGKSLVNTWREEKVALKTMAKRKQSHTLTKYCTKEFASSTCILCDPIKIWGFLWIPINNMVVKSFSCWSGRINWRANTLCRIYSHSAIVVSITKSKDFKLHCMFNHYVFAVHLRDFSHLLFSINPMTSYWIYSKHWA